MTLAVHDLGTLLVSHDDHTVPPGGKKPTAEVKTLLEAAKLLGL